MMSDREGLSHGDTPSRTEPSDREGAREWGRGAGGPGEAFDRWRSRVLRRLLLVMVVLGGVAYLPSVWLAVDVGAWGIVVLDTAAYAALLAVYWLDRVEYAVRAGILLLVFVGLGVGLVLVLGPFNAGPYYLFAVPPLAALFFGMRETVAALALVAALSTGLWMSGVMDPLIGSAAGEGTDALGVVLGANALFTTGLISLAIAWLVRGLRESMEEAQAVNRALAAERTRLARAHERLVESSRDRERAEERLRHSEQLTAIGTLAGGIAHDFNNLLTPILTALELLRLDPGMSEEERTVLLQDAGDAGRRARDLVRRILAFSRPTDRAPVALDLGRAVRDAVRLLRASIPGNVVLEERIDEETGHASLSPTDLQQIMLNLGSNAYHAMREEGGRLVVEVRPARRQELPEEASAEEHLLIRVADTGPGMDPETVRRALEPFFTTKPVGEGTGIGLSSVHGIVVGAGGGMSIDSEVGVGTTICIFLPRAAPEAVESPVAPEALPRGDGYRILVVDDEASVRASTGRFLRRLGYAVREAADADEALQVLETDPEAVDLLVTDVAMPGRSGIDLAEAVATRWGDLPVVLMSGLVDEALRRRAEAAGCDHVLVKPFELDEVALMIRDARPPGESAPE